MTPEELAEMLERPPLALAGLAQLDAGQIDDLAARIERALAQHRQALDAALDDAVPWPLRAPLLRWLRR